MMSPQEDTGTIFKNKEVLFYALILTVCFLLFQQADLFHTTLSTFTFLRGHFLDFYDYNKNFLVRNDYLPFLYLVISAWNVVLKITGLPPETAGYSFLTVLWTKVLLAVCFFLAGRIIYKIALIITEKNVQASKISACLFLASPIAIFAVFIFGQYDIIGIAFTLAGFYYYLKKDLLKFAVFFSFAISFKYFPVVIFFPLVLLAEKELKKIIKLSAVACSLTILQIALYLAVSPHFRDTFFFLPLGKVSSAASFFLTPFILIAYASMCVYFWSYKVKNDATFYRISVAIPILSYALVFLTVTWHPQWIILTMPFFALSYCFIDRKKAFYFIETLGAISYFWVVASGWPGHVDNFMIKYGLLGGFFKHVWLRITDILPYGFNGFFTKLFYLYLFSPVFLLLLDRKQIEVSNNFPKKLFKMRFVVGIGFFLIPALFCSVVPLSVASMINQNAISLGTIAGTYTPSDSNVPAKEIYGDKCLEQRFKAEHEGLTAISILLATFARKNTSTIELSMLDDQNQVLHKESTPASRIRDNDFQYYSFPPMANSKDKPLLIRICSPDGGPGNAITAWTQNNSVQADRSLSYGGDKIDGNLVFQTYYMSK